MTPAQRQAWIAKWAPAAQATQREYGVPASITLAQAILESGWGQSKLALPPNNNYFGIKASSNGPYVEFPTKEFVNGHPYLEEGAKFEKFATVADSFDRHGELIATDPRYRPAMCICHDYVAFAAQLQACGYSTNPKYSQELLYSICRYGLSKFDIPPEPPQAEAKTNAA